MTVKKTILFYITIISLVFSQVSCDSDNEENENNVQSKQETTVYKPGGFVYKIDCRTDQSQSYAAYFPASYKPQTQFPIIIVFDAHARGKMAVRKFQKAADEYGYIVVASNNAKNGLKTIDNTINVLFDDIFYRFNINKNRVYTAGFSGGAKVASSVAIYKGGIAGVMAIAGGLPKVGQEISSKFDFATIVGIEDFNFLELRTLDKQMKKLGFPHLLTITEKGHSWPDEETLITTIEWFEIQSMKRGDIPTNDNLIRNYSQFMADSINDLVLKGKVYEAKKLYEQFLSTLDGLYDITEYQKSYDVLLKNPDIKIQETEIETAVKAEAEKQQQYINLFKKQSFKQLMHEIEILKSGIQTKNVLKMNKAKRLLNYMSMLSYVFSESTLKNNDSKIAEKYLSIYKKADPNNPDYYFFNACVFANKNMEKEALESLNKAVEFGFFDTSELEAEKCFSKINKLTEFESIVTKAKINFDEL
ncbi:MAG: hypothetical protein DRJ07_14525 [Bacteroidetes bacterium]|nr:MAG: hypothetical protein DRJ07_14525 [Bacteroidota bacterium]